VARYHPIYEGLWDDAKLEGLSFECHGFFAFLCSNKRCRPSGIYRATDGQLAEDSGLPLARVRTYLDALATRSRIVRDGGWLFVRGYLERQPKHERLMKQVADDVKECTSEAIREAFFQRYPLLLQPMRALVGKLPAYTSSSPAPAPAVTTGSSTSTQNSARAPTAPKRAVLADAEFIEALKNNAAYKRLDLELQLGKFHGWFLTPRGRGKQPTRGRLVAWLNRALEELPLQESRGREEPYGLER